MNHGEIWLVNFSSQLGDKIAKLRPAIVINSNDFGKLKLKIVIPITDGIRSIEDWHIKINPTATNGLTKLSSADCFQIKSISTARFVNKIGIVSKDDLEKIKLCLISVLEIIDLL